MNVGITRRCRATTPECDATGYLTRKAATQFYFRQDNGVEPVKIFSNRISPKPDGIEILEDC